AAAIADDGFSHIVTFIQPGLTELEIALELEFYMRKNGGESVSFDVICASGQRSSLPHAVPGQRCIRKGDFIVLDFGCKVNGYCSDMTRTVAVGSVTEEQKKIYQLVYRAQMECLKQLHSGMRCSDFDKIARDLFIKEGYGAYFGHGLGHGVGLEIHEAPTANSRSKEVFQENMLITVEPGIYLEKKFGVRIEDLAIIEKRGIINLSNSTKELLIL
ncbi:MAG: M24 family metallopeptidase, partial [Anaerovorax sp.]